MPYSWDEEMKTKKGRLLHGLILATPATLACVYVVYAVFPVITATTLNHEVGFGATVISYGPHAPQFLLQGVAIWVFTVTFTIGFFMKETTRFSHRIERRLFGMTFEELVLGRGVVGADE